MMGALAQLTEAGILAQGDADELRKHYEYLRSIESVLRRWENKNVSALPADKAAQEQLARRVGAKDLDSFAQTYREARAGIRAIYSRSFR
jgi:glutamine synthetase adenylyltransferase